MRAHSRLKGVTGIVVLALTVSMNSARGATPTFWQDDRATTRLAFDPFDGERGLDWKILHRDPTHYSMTRVPGCLTITTQEGGFAGRGAEDYENLFLLDCPRIANADLQVSARLVGFHPIGEWNQAGLVLYRDDDNYLKWVYEYAGGRRVFTVVGERNGDWKLHEHFAGRQERADVWLGITRRRGRFTVSLSFDGQTDLAVGEFACDLGDLPRAGLVAKNAAGSSAPEIDAPFDDFELRAVAPQETPFLVPLRNQIIPTAQWPRVVCLQRLYGAIRQYDRERGRLPLWLSDLVPDVAPAEALVCSDDPNRTVHHCPDPRMPCSFSYQFAPWRPRVWTGRPDTYRSWRDRQRGIYGDAVPLVRCPFVRDQVEFLNLALNGCVYRSERSWERVLRPNYRSLVKSGDSRLISSPPPIHSPSRRREISRLSPFFGEKWDSLGPFGPLGPSGP